MGGFGANIEFGPKVLGEGGIEAYPNVGIDDSVGINEDFQQCLDTFSFEGIQLPPMAGHDGKYLRTDGTNVYWSAVDHGALSGLVDDDHTIYHTDARGDIRYLKRSANDLNTFTEKTTPVGADILLIEDSEDSWNKKKITISKFSDNNYVHTQSSGSSTWNIAHNLGKYPSIQLFDDSYNMIIAEIIHVDTDNAQAVFGESLTGKAVCN